MNYTKISLFFATILVALFCSVTLQAAVNSTTFVTEPTAVTAGESVTVTIDYTVADPVSYPTPYLQLQLYNASGVKVEDKVATVDGMGTSHTFTFDLNDTISGGSGYYWWVQLMKGLNEVEEGAWGGLSPSQTTGTSDVTVTAATPTLHNTTVINTAPTEVAPGETVNVTVSYTVADIATYPAPYLQVKLRDHNDVNAQVVAGLFSVNTSSGSHDFELVIPETPAGSNYYWWTQLMAGSNEVDPAVSKWSGLSGSATTGSDVTVLSGASLSIATSRSYISVDGQYTLTVNYNHEDAVGGSVQLGLKDASDGIVQEWSQAISTVSGTATFDITIPETPLGSDYTWYAKLQSASAVLDSIDGASVAVVVEPSISFVTAPAVVASGSIATASVNYTSDQDTTYVQIQLKDNSGWVVTNYVPVYAASGSVEFDFTISDTLTLGDGYFWWAQTMKTSWGGIVQITGTDVTIIEADVFTGTGNWSESARWSNGIPGATDTVNISGVCTVDASYECKDLLINSGSLTISPSKILTVSGTLTNSVGASGLVLSSTASGTGMLMNNTAGVAATVQQYLVKDQWHYMGIPLTTVANANDVFHNCYLLKSNESTAVDGTETGWENVLAGESLSALKGYAVQYNRSTSTNDTTITFTGTLNTGTVSTSFPTVNSGWKFVSNPYPITMDWESGVTLANVNNAIYLWSPAVGPAGDYGTYGSYLSGDATNGQTQYIAPSQGFFIEVNAAAANLEFTNACKSTEASVFKSETLTTNIRLAITDNDVNYDEMLLRVNPNTSLAFDGSYDAHKMKAMESKQPQLYSVIDQEEFSINSIPELTNETSIQLNVVVKGSGTNKLLLSELENYNYAYPILLKDSNGKVLANLESETYEFEGKAGEVKTFFLAFSSQQTSSDIITDQSIGLSVYGSELVIKGLNNINSSVQVYDLSGRLVYKNKVSTCELTIPMAKRGAYIIHVTPDQGSVFNGKAIINF